MDNLYLESFFFAVPYRLVWNNWEKFNGYQVNPGDSTDFTVPQITGPEASGVVVGSLADYMGIPPGILNLKFNALHFRAYNLIWNEWFRDENMQDSVPVNLGDGLILIQIIRCLDVVSVMIILLLVFLFLRKDLMYFYP